MCGTCPWILREDFNMWWLSVKFLPWLLTDKQAEWQSLAPKSTALDRHWCGLLWFLLVSKNEIATPYDSISFPRMKLHLWRIVSRKSQKLRINLWLPYMQFPKVSSIGSSSGPVAWNGKGASMKGWQGPITKVFMYFIISSVWELLDTPSNNLLLVINCLVSILD